MKEIKTDLLTCSPENWIIITVNGQVTSNGLVMGGGVAKAAKDAYSKLPKLLGELTRQKGNIPHVLPEYKIITWPTKPGWHNLNGEVHPGWQCMSKHKTAECHKQVANLVFLNGPKIVEIVKNLGIEKIYVPKPGCGLGGLDWRKVKPWLETIMDDTFIIVDK